MRNVFEFYLLILSRSLDRPMRDIGAIVRQCYCHGIFLGQLGIMRAVWYVEILKRGSGALGKALERVR